MNILHSSKIYNKLKLHENECKDHIYCNIKNSEAWNETLKFTQNHKSMDISFIIYVDIETLLEEIASCNSHVIKSFTSKANEHMVCGCPLTTL